jgi:thymidylate synthase
MKTAEPQYLALLAKLVKQAKSSKPVQERTGTGVWCRFGDTIKFDTTNQQGQRTLPLFSSKHVAFDFVVAELLWFLSGSTNVNDLPAKWQHLWRPWADADGSLGLTYGYQFRQGTDAFMRLLRGLLTEPESRRHVLTLWDNADVSKCKLPPCHGTVIQFHVDSGTLHMATHQRSADIFLGVPYNLASYTLLLHIVASAVGLKSGRVIYHFGNLHLYANHLDAAKQQLAGVMRYTPFVARPTYKLAMPPVLDMVQIRFEHFDLDNYRLDSSFFNLTGYSAGTKIHAPLAI